ncbi:MAG TPA: hypothetical protein PLQ41_05160 [bacterium]|nr:hypothetical protein [bacterium]
MQSGERKEIPLTLIGKWQIASGKEPLTHTPLSAADRSLLWGEGKRKYPSPQPSPRWGEGKKEYIRGEGKRMQMKGKREKKHPSP